MSAEPSTFRDTHAVAGETPLSLYCLVEAQAQQDAGAPALRAPGRAALTYGGLLAQMDEVRRALNAVGIGRGDRVATVLPNGPEMAAAFLSVAAGATCAPLNPAYREAEFEFYLRDLKPKAVIVERGAPSPAVAAAGAQGIPLICLVPRMERESGAFRLEHHLPAAAAAGPGPAAPDDIALLLHTSGTTSRPKLVPLTNANLCHSARHIRQALELTNADRCLNVMPLFHIHGLAGAVLSSLAAGASVACSPGFFAPRFFEWLEEFRPTWYTAVPAMHQAILARASGNRDAIARCRLRFIRSCSAALPPQVMAELERVFGAPAIESYGMTEAAHQVASNPLPPLLRKPGSVGKAAGPQIAILDAEGNVLESGETGEIVIRGPNVTPGYGHNPEANQRAFTRGWFRTGDRGFLDQGGYLFLSGRTKEMINRGGEKISPREIDEALMDHPAVAQALAFALPDPKLGEEVAAAVVVRENAAATELELREFAARRLADFKVPRRIVFLAEIPKGPTGKPQRIGLAAKLGVSGAAPVREAARFVAPRTPAEAALCNLWRQVLRTERVGVLDNFFDLGGDSVLAAQLLARIGQTTGVEMPMLALFAAPTLEGVAGWLESAAGREQQAKAPALEAGSTAGEMPLAFAQERMWFLAQLEQDSAPYLRAAAFRLKGPLDVGALERSLNRIVERQEALRTTFRGRSGIPVQVVSPARPLPLEVLDLTALEEAARMERVRQLAAEQAHQPFELSRDLMLRASLARLAPEDHCLLLSMHHIASDGWSTRVFLRELAALYGSLVTGRPADLPELRIQYGDYARWQRSWLAGEALARQLSYWKRRLEGLPPLLPLATDRPRPPRQSYRGARESLALSPELTGALERLSRQEQATLFMTLLAAFQVLLHRYTTSEDIAVGCPVANRTRVETEPLIGLFVNTLVLRTDLSGEPGFREVLARVREGALGAYAHQDMPFEKLVEALEPARSLSYSPLFQVMFQLRNLPFESVRLPGLQIEPVEFDPKVAQFDLVLDISAAGDGLRAVLDYNTDLFDQATARRMLGHYRTLLEGIVQDPGARIAALPLLTGAQRRQVLVEWSGAARDCPPGPSIPELFQAQAERTPDRVAVTFGSEQITYRELNRRTNQLARKLRSLGVGPEAVAGVCVERSPRAVVALLAILKAGCAFLPLDPRCPKERLAFLLEDARAPVLVTEQRLLASLPERLPHLLSLDAGWDEIARESPDNLPSQCPPESLAYVVYTSGSTGRPKGVLGLHQGLLNRLHWMWAAYPYEAGEVCCQKTALSFVDSIAEIFGPLLQGVPLVILSDDAVKGSPLELIRLLERNGITRIILVPSLLASLLDGLASLGHAPPRLKYWVSSGEALTSEMAARFGRLVPQAVLINLYGSSEVSADVTWYEVAPNQAPNPVPIGRPIANTQVYILDSHLEPVPAGVPGELYVGGAGLARGYLNLPELTAERFIANPFGGPGSRLFRTGDLGRYRPDGNIEFLGRADDQVKVRGCRVEPAEVEAALARHPAVKAAAAAVREGESGEGRLVAYVVRGRENGVTAADLRSFLKSKLPEYMTPSHFVFLDTLPRLPNGKVDRRALPDPGGSMGQTQAAFLGPRDDHESRLARVWEELLGTGPIGVNDDFFDLGGHSLLAARMAARIEEVFGAAVPVATLFEAPTVAQLAAMMRGDVSPAYPPRVVPIQAAGSRPRFFCVGGGPVLRPLAQQLGLDQPLFGLTLDEADAREFAPPYSLRDIAGLLVRSLREYQPEGPYYLGGYSLHGVYAYEAAQQLRAQGQEVALLVLFDTFLPAAARRQCGLGLRTRAHLLSLCRQLGQLRLKEAARHVLGAIAMAGDAAREAARRAGAQASSAGSHRLLTLWEILRPAAAQYRPEPYPGTIVFFEAATQPLAREVGACFGWAGLAGGGLNVRTVPGDHGTLLGEPNVDALARELDACLRAARSTF